MRRMTLVVWVAVVGCFGSPPDVENAEDDEGDDVGVMTMSSSSPSSSSPSSSASASSSSPESSSTSEDESSETSGDASTGSEDDSSSTGIVGGGDPSPFLDCWPTEGKIGQNCPMDEYAPYGCIRSEDPKLAEDDYPSACAMGCDPLDDFSCPPAAGGVEAVCLNSIAVGASAYCVLPCELDEHCPDDMACIPLHGFDDGAGGEPRVCLWP